MLLKKKKSLEPIKKACFEKMYPDGGWWKEMKPLWRNREINHGETDGGGCGCVCVCVTVIGDGGLEWDTFIGWVTERWVQRQTVQETRIWNSQIIYNGAFENRVLLLLLSQFPKFVPGNSSWIIRSVLVAWYFWVQTTLAAVFFFVFVSFFKELCIQFHGIGINFTACEIN